MVGAMRFELTTSCTRNKRATRLRYAPTQSAETLPRTPDNCNDVFSRPPFDIVNKAADATNAAIARPPHFALCTSTCAWFSSSMVGTIINAAAILVGGVAGLMTKKTIPVAHQNVLKILLGVFTVYAGLSATWGALGGALPRVLKQLVIILASLMLGNLTGRLLRIQKSLNRLGQHARQAISGARPAGGSGFNDGFVTGSILFCAAPLAILGSLEDGFAGDIRPLAIKAVMDALTAMALVRTIGWGVTAAAIPVLAGQGTITLLARLAQPWLARHSLVDPLNAIAGLLVFCVALVILELKKIELVNYLPGLIYAPLLTWLWR